MIFLIRHTKPATPARTCYGQTDVALDSSHEQERKAIIKKLGDITFDEIHTSPLTRCKTLALAMPNNVDAKFHEDPRLMELNFGNWELKPWDDINLVEMTTWCNNFIENAIPGGESFNEMYSRVMESWEEISQNHEKNIAIVCHAGTIRVILSKLLDIPLSKVFNVQLFYGQIVKLQRTSHDNWLVTFM